AADDERLPRPPPHRAAQEAVQLLAPAGAALAVAAAREAAAPADRPRARDRPRRRGAGRARRGRGAGASPAAARRGRRSRVALPAPLLRQPGARATDQGDRARGVPRRVPLGLPRGTAALPRVRAVLDGLPER